MIFSKRHLQQGILSLIATLWVAGVSAEPMPGRLVGSWRITKILSTTNISCWDNAAARHLLGTTLTYRSKSMHWSGGEVPLHGIVTRELTAADFHDENNGSGGGVGFGQIGIHASFVTEVDLQHDDADVTGCSTEVPGDSVLMAGHDRIVFGVAGTFYEAKRVAKPR